MEAFFDQKVLTEEQKVRHLLSSLTGTAREVLEPYLHLKTVAELKECLDKAFQLFTNPMSRLESLQHEPNQTVRIFASRVTAAVFRYFGYTEHPSFEDTCIAIFMKKLRPEFSAKIHTRPDNFQTAVKIAAAAETELLEKRASIGFNTLLTATQSTLDNPQPIQNARNLTRNEEVKDLKARVEQLAVAFQQKQTRNSDYSSERPPRKCYICESTAHTYLYCPKATEEEIRKFTEKLENARQRRMGTRDDNRILVRRNDPEFRRERPNDYNNHDSEFRRERPNDYNNRNFRFTRSSNSNNDKNHLNSIQVATKDSPQPLKNKKGSS
jgi:hypothetical protein